MRDGILIKNKEGTDRAEQYSRSNEDNDPEFIEVEDTTVFPYSSICYIRARFSNGDTAYATAFLVDEHLALTAGHSIYDRVLDEWATQITVWPGRKGEGLFDKPYGSTTVVNMHTSTVWINDGNPAYDWGMIELDDHLGLQAGWLGFGWSANDLTGTQVTLSGYPSSLNSKQSIGSGTIYLCAPNRFYYYINSEEGHSGSPLYDSNHITWGIHTRGEIADDSSATRITEWLFNYIKSHKDLLDNQ